MNREKKKIFIYKPCWLKREERKKSSSFWESICSKYFANMCNLELIKEGLN
jgi:hypothetical protein